MIHFLRHYTVRLWASLLAGSLLVIIGFPVLGGQLGLSTAFWGVLVSFLVLFFLGGWFGNALGMHWINRLMREAAIWERAGNFRQSEKLFKKAVSIFDSFLISPIAREEKSRQLPARMARFYLAQQMIDPAADGFILAYLHRHPEDEEVSEMWLQKADMPEQRLREHDELAFKIGNAQPENKSLQRLLARACLLSERSDYPALKTYRRIIEDDTPDDRRIIDDIAVSFHNERRADRWALQAYLTAFRADRKKTWLLRGIAVCMHRSSASDRTSRAYKEAGKLLSRLDETTLRKMREGFVPPVSLPAVPTVSKKSERIGASLRALASGASALTAAVSEALLTAGKAYAALYYRLKNHKNTRPFLKWSAVGLAGTGLIVLVINTAGHLISSRETAPPEPEQPAEIVITDPFTLQVAAYLKVEHAEKFVSTLKSMGLDAYYTEARSTQSNWFQVRISHFPTKDAARAHGEALKTKGVIDDFYVANYQRP